MNCLCPLQGEVQMLKEQFEASEPAALAAEVQHLSQECAQQQHQLSILSSQLEATSFGSNQSLKEAKRILEGREAVLAKWKGEALLVSVRLVVLISATGFGSIREERR
jgi:hypothetical protein